MSLELPADVRRAAIASIERYFHEHMDEPIGNVAAAGLLGFFLEEIGPSLYNRGVADAQENMQMRISEVDIEVHRDTFQYWNNAKHRTIGRK